MKIVYQVIWCIKGVSSYRFYGPWFSPSISAVWSTHRDALSRGANEVGRKVCVCVQHRLPCACMRKDPPPSGEYSGQKKKKGVL